MAWMAEQARFLFSFLKNPIRTGAVLPSSRWLARLMVEDMGLKEASTVLEIGPGTGAFTEAIAAEAGPDALILAIELNPQFAADLARKFPRVQVVADSAENVAKHLAFRGKSLADCILSSLPWAGFPEELQDKLLGAISAVLKPGGKFATFAYIHASKFPAARRLKVKLGTHFGAVETTRVEWRNVPPAMVYRCHKPT